jgi:DNA-binding response OmpR family regulator
MKSILLIDRSRKSSEVVEEMLRRFAFHVEIAEGGVTAQRLARETEYDLILMEFLSRPELDESRTPCVEMLGEEFGKSTALIRELRAKPVLCPIIVYTTLKGELYETASLDAGADDYVLKTAHSSVLLARLHAHLRRRQRELGEAKGEDRRTSIGKFVIDRQTRILLSDHTPIQLTPMEVSLLERLAANPYRTVSITEMLDHVWADRVGRSHDALEALLQRLRKKMDRHGLPNPIETVRGRGLKLSPPLLPVLAAASREVPRRNQRLDSKRNTDR